MVWTGWELGRVMVLLVGLAFVLIFVQVTLFHYRQNFRNAVMWLPVIAGPIIGIVAIILALVNSLPLKNLTLFLLWAGLFGGLIGFVYHYRGVGLRVDGYVMRNFMVGPPVILPLMFSALALVGLFALYWR